MNIGARIKEIRTSNKVSAKSLAEKIGVSSVFLSYIENGSKNPSLDTIEKICTVFDISLSDFFTDSNNIEPLTDDLQELFASVKELHKEQIEALTYLIKTFKKG